MISDQIKGLKLDSRILLEKYEGNLVIEFNANDLEALKLLAGLVINVPPMEKIMLDAIELAHAARADKEFMKGLEGNQIIERVKKEGKV